MGIVRESRGSRFNWIDFTDLAQQLAYAPHVLKGGLVAALPYGCKKLCERDACGHQANQGTTQGHY